MVELSQAELELRVGGRGSDLGLQGELSRNDIADAHLEQAAMVDLLHQQYWPAQLLRTVQACEALMRQN